MKKKYDDAKQRFRDLETLQILAARYDDVESFLSDLAIDPPEFGREPGESDSEDEWMTLSTVHSAKGLEWHTVFVVHLCSGQFPSWSSQGDEAAYEEERRLLYVAVTRAKENLYLLKPDLASPRSWEIAELSPLIAEIPGFAGLTEEYAYVPERREDEGHDDDVHVSQDRLDRIQDYFS